MPYQADGQQKPGLEREPAMTIGRRYRTRPPSHETSGAWPGDFRAEGRSNDCLLMAKRIQAKEVSKALEPGLVQECI